MYFNFRRDERAFSVAYPRGEWGVRTPHFSKFGPRDSHKNVIKLVVGGGVGQICQEVVSEILQKKANNGFSSVGSKALLSKECLKTAGRGILSQS